MNKSREKPADRHFLCLIQPLPFHVILIPPKCNELEPPESLNQGERETMVAFQSQ